MTCWVLDEAEELIDESIFDKIDASIRSMQAHNEVILVYNAPYKTHWIYKRFYEKRGLTDVYNGAIDDTQYIYTTYLDNKPNLSESYLSIAEKCKVDDNEKYEHIYLVTLQATQRGLFINIGNQSESLKFRNILSHGMRLTSGSVTQRMRLSGVITIRTVIQCTIMRLIM